MAKSRRRARGEGSVFQRKDGLAPKTINSIHGVLHMALKNAVLWNVVSRNVCDVVSPPRMVKTEKQSLTMEQAHTLIESVRGHRLEMLLTLALTMAMRRGEMLALRWADIDLDRQTIRVQRTVDYIPRYGYVENEPKTAAGRRTLMIPSFVVEMLKQHHIQQLETRLKAGSSKNGSLYDRNDQLLTKSAPSHVEDIWSHAEQYLQKLLEIDKDERDVLEIAWTEYREPVLLELAQHILYRPRYHDGELFPHGSGSVKYRWYHKSTCLRRLI